MAPWTLPLALQLLHQQYPGAYVTSGQRDPNSALGRKNPRSYHNIGEAFDIRPMQGVQFNDYVSSLKKAGLPVVEALDEAARPAFDTTGPNWHIAFSGQQAPQKETKPMLTPEQRAAMFNISLPPEQAPAQPFDLQSALSKVQLPDYNQGIQASLDANKIKGDERAKHGSTMAAIIGAISDGLLTLSGNQPMYAPLALRQREDDADRNLARDRLQAEIDQRNQELQAKLDHPDVPGIINEYQTAVGSGYLPQGTSYQQYLGMRFPGMSAPVVLPPGATPERTIVRTGTSNGRKVVQYSDGSIEYAN